MSFQTWLIRFIFFTLTNITTFVTAQSPSNNHCLNNGNYTSNSAYSNNLNTIFSSLSSDMSPQGFLNASMGQTPDRVNVIALCRPDIQPVTCRSCIQDASVELVNRCPNQRQAILWSDLCTLRYSNDSIYGIMVDSPYARIMADNVPSPQQFNEDRRTLLVQLREQAFAGGSLIKVAAANRTVPDFDTIYGLLQCSPDISSNECNICLSIAAQRLPECCTN